MLLADLIRQAVLDADGPVTPGGLARRLGACPFTVEDRLIALVREGLLVATVRRNALTGLPFHSYRLKEQT